MTITGFRSGRWQRGRASLVTGLGLLLATGGCERPAKQKPDPVAKTVEPLKSVAVEVEQPAVTPEPAVRSDSCQNLPFFIVYRQGKAVLKESDTEVQLDVGVNLHSADCGAPDGYGHHMTLTLGLKAKGDRCSITSATANGEEWGYEGSRASEKWTNDFTVKGDPNLADPGLKEIELRDPSRKEALMLCGKTISSSRRYRMAENSGRSLNRTEGLQG